jgi:hypothetical protein
MHAPRRTDPSLSRRRFATGLAAVATATITAPVWDVVCATLRARRLARREEIDDGPTRASRVVMLRTRTVPVSTSKELSGRARREGSG